MKLALAIAFIALPCLGQGWVTAEVFAFCKCTKCTYGLGITASGKKAEGKMLAAPRKYPFGTRVYIPGYGISEVQDRGGAIRAAGERVNGKVLKYDRFDCLMPSHAAARKAGRRIERVYVYSPEQKLSKQLTKK
jgi:3D (Asp-Asp-Asp) domain-containing protein